jgi:dihydrodipicolinate synthase/N-acetylneuraminate lyase
MEIGLESDDTVDADRLIDCVNRMIEDGIDVVSAMGSYGEFHTLTDSEFKTVVKATLEAVNKRVPVMIGVTSMNSREVVRKAKIARDLGAEGLFTGVPFYYPPTVDNTVAFYHELADFFPNMSIQIYHNPPLQNIHIPVAAFHKLTQKRNIVSMKDSHRSTLEFIRLVDVTKGKLSVFVNQMQYYPYQSLGARGFWSTDAAMGPYPLLHYRNCTDAGDAQGATQVLRDVMALSAGDDWMGPQDNARKLGASHSGYANQGPNRPPFRVVTPESLEKAIKRGEGWGKLNDKYKPLVQARALAGAAR